MSIVCDIEKNVCAVGNTFFVVNNVKSCNDNITGEEVSEMVRNLVKWFSNLNITCQIILPVVGTYVLF